MKWASGEKFAAFGAGLVLLVAAAGCQCTGLEDAAGDLVDDINQREPELDGLYHAEWVPRRIGDAQWCRSPINRFFCRRQCNTCSTCAPVDITSPVDVSADKASDSVE